MKMLVKENMSFLIIFLIIVLKEPIYKIFIPIKEDLNSCSYLEKDYNELLKFSKIDLIYESKYINTPIIYKDIYNNMDEITIRGGRDLSLKNNPIIYNNTLIGIISNNNKNSSIVRLITNKNSNISVKINGEVGILKFLNEKLIVSDIDNYNDISIGDKIYTSGFGNIRSNIFIGTVKNIIIDNKMIEKIIIVDYKINIKEINYVTVLMENI